MLQSLGRVTSPQDQSEWGVGRVTSPTTPNELRPAAHIVFWITSKAAPAPTIGPGVPQRTAVERKGRDAETPLPGITRGKDIICYSRPSTPQSGPGVPQRTAMERKGRDAKTPLPADIGITRGEMF